MANGVNLYLWASIVTMPILTHTDTKIFSRCLIAIETSDVRLCKELEI